MKTDWEKVPQGKRAVEFAAYRYLKREWSLPGDEEQDEREEQEQEDERESARSPRTAGK